MTQHHAQPSDARRAAAVTPADVTRSGRRPPTREPAARPDPATGEPAHIDPAAASVSAPTFGTTLTRVIAQLAGAGAGLLALGLILGLTLVGRRGDGPLHGWDHTVWAWSIGHRGPLVGVSKVVDLVGDAGAFGIGCFVLTVLLFGVLRSPRALIPLVAYLGGEALVFLLRLVIHRHRPPSADYPGPGALPTVHQTSYSFPSGHAVAVTAVVFALLGALALTRRWWWPWLLALTASLFVIDTRLVLGVHWFSDVVLGLPLGIGWGLTVAQVAHRTPTWPVTGRPSTAAATGRA